MRVLSTTSPGVMCRVSGPAPHFAAMRTPFLGSEALAAGALTCHALRSRHTAVYPDVLVRRDEVLSAAGKAQAAWLWSRRRGIVAGCSAAALHGAHWVDAARPAEIIHHNRRPPANLVTWSDAIAADEVATIRGVPVTSAARTVLDLGCRRPPEHAVADIDAVLRATGVSVADVVRLADRYPGRRGIRRARRALDLADGGAESPRETWLRLLLVGSGRPRPRTQIRVRDEFGQVVARVDMGWEELRIAVEYDGDHHWTNRRQLARDIRRTEELRDLGWIVIRVVADDTAASILGWVDQAFARRA